jgi:ParB-like chromosome segregation protein Spo0J
MRLIKVPVEELVMSVDLSRSRTSKVFEEHLRASIDEMGLAEPIKVAQMPSNKYLVIDGVFRLRAILKLREDDESRFAVVPAYVVDYSRRFEIRYQTDIYQDLLPSQLAGLVEHLHQAENVRKVDIARYIGVSPATLRNYTGLWRLLQREGLFARIVDLMDVGVLPASNPYAWLRLTADGLKRVLETEFAGDAPVEEWIESRIMRARRGDVAPYQLKAVEAATDSLPAKYYLAGEEVRSQKRDLGLRRAAAVKKKQPALDFDASEAIDHLLKVSKASEDKVLQLAAASMASYLR